MLLELDQVTKNYRLGDVEVRALRGLSLEIEEGEFAALMGASGSGKTTLLNILGALDTPTSGTYRLDGQDIDAKDPDDLASVRAASIGFVFQSFNLVPVLSALENVELPMQWHPSPRPAKERLDRARHLLEQVGLGDMVDRRPGQLSGGQQQRVAVARALANAPKVVLADEPTANLDTETADVVLDAMAALWRAEGTTFVLATHDPRILARASRVIYVVDGVVGLGPMHDHETGVFNKPYFENRLEEELRRATRAKEPTGVLLLEAEGEPRALADLLTETLRGSDTIARYAQDRFAVLLPGADESAAEQTEARLEKACEGLKLVRADLPPGSSDAREVLATLTRRLDG